MTALYRLANTAIQDEVKLAVGCCQVYFVVLQVVYIGLWDELQNVVAGF